MGSYEAVHSQPWECSGRFYLGSFHFIWTSVMDSIQIESCSLLHHHVKARRDEYSPGLGLRELRVYCMDMVHVECLMIPPFNIYEASRIDTTVATSSELGT